MPTKLPLLTRSLVRRADDYSAYPPRYSILDAANFPQPLVKFTNSS